MMIIDRTLKKSNQLDAGQNKYGFLQGFLALIIIALGIVGSLLFIKYKKTPQHTEQDVQIPLVNVERVQFKDIPVTVQGYGTVKPGVEIDIIPEVSGKVVSIHPELKVGGLIRKDERILQIDPRDYELALMQAEAAVADATVLLETEQAEAEMARKEWEQLHPDSEPASKLVLREPQIRKAKAALDSAKAQLASANLKLERTSLVLPFDVLVITESVDLGQYVVAGQSLASAYGTQTVEIEVPLEDNELAWFDVFANSLFADNEIDLTENIKATVTAEFAGKQQIWDGYVVRTTGQVDRNSRMVSVIVEVPDPFAISEGKNPLLPGMFVNVLITGKTLMNAIALPRDAIRQGDQIWIINNDRLHIKTVDIVRADQDFAYIVSGIDDQAQVVTSPLDIVVDGMEVRTNINIKDNSEQINQDNAITVRPEVN